MDWCNTNYSELPFHVSALIAEHGRQAVYDLYLNASKNTSEPQRSHALAYLAAGIDTLPARVTAEKFSSAVEIYKKDLEAYDKSFRSMGSLVMSIDFQSLVFWDYLVDKARPVIFKNIPVRPFIAHPQPAELIVQKIASLNEECLKYKDYIDGTYINLLRTKVFEYCSDSLISQAEQQIAIYRYFTSYESLFATHEEREKLSTHVRFDVKPGALHELVSKGELYRELESKIKRLKKIVSKIGSLKAQADESQKKYSFAKSEVEKLVPYGLAHYIENYEDIVLAKEARVKVVVDC
ncbi:hypothetical protein SAMN03159437_02618 [Pseudomonas sp. NFACC25]|uniref:hypothetical protein n=1 Tax=Pseudomonas sp. NFACC25 TaxID=1566188 RepID=UPI000876ED84|nr:hypothetical protein [Pseudomonas sp. NFACC25]SCX25032.1 hypothetical protein SAMN03159437_02618 [Pseudomonas sp. NFACC25]